VEHSSKCSSPSAAVAEIGQERSVAAVLVALAGGLVAVTADED